MFRTTLTNKIGILTTSSDDAGSEEICGCAGSSEVRTDGSVVRDGRRECSFSSDGKKNDAIKSVVGGFDVIVCDACLFNDNPRLVGAGIGNAGSSPSLIASLTCYK